MDTFKIRDFKTEDYPQIISLWEKTDLGNPQRGDNLEIINKTISIGGKFLVLELLDNKQIIGTSWITNDGRRLYLHHFGIHPEYQGKKYSILLLKASLEYAKILGLQIKLEVHKENLKAINLYKKYSFKYLGDYDVYIIRDLEKIEV